MDQCIFNFKSRMWLRKWRKQKISCQPPQMIWKHSWGKVCLRCRFFIYLIQIKLNTVHNIYIYTFRCMQWTNNKRVGGGRIDSSASRYRLITRISFSIYKIILYPTLRYFVRYHGRVRNCIFWETSAMRFFASTTDYFTNFMILYGTPIPI